MTPLDLAGYLIAALMTAVAVWRMPAALWGDEEDKRRRALWGCYAGFAAALWTKTQVVRIGLNDSPVTDLSVLIKHYTATVAILAILSYIVAIYGQYPDAGDIPRHVRFARTIQQVAAKASVATLVLLTVLFFTVVDRSVPSDRFVSDHAGQWGATLYMSVFYLYLGAASAVCAYQWALATAGARLRHLRVGLGMMTFAMFIGVGYTVSRTLFLWVSVIDRPSPAFALEFDEVTEAAQLVLFAFFAVGASIPAFSKGGRRVKLWRAQSRLHALWYELMTAFPDQPFEPPRSLRRELTRFDTPADLRIDRWTADIADAVEKLRHYVPDGLLPAAEAAAAADTPDPAKSGPLADAYWIKAALTARNAGAPQGRPGRSARSTPPTRTAKWRGWCRWRPRTERSPTTGPGASWRPSPTWRRQRDVHRRPDPRLHRRCRGVGRPQGHGRTPAPQRPAGRHARHRAGRRGPLDRSAVGPARGPVRGARPGRLHRVGAGRGTWGDRHVVDRTKRAPIFFVILGSIGAGSVVMVLGHAPTGILVAMLALWAMTVVLLAVNTVWKISVDASVASAVVALLAAVHSPWWLLAYAMTAAVCWSRVALGYHTAAQVVAGASLGAATAGAFLLV